MDRRTKDVLGVLGFLLWLASIVLVAYMTGGNYLVAVIYGAVTAGIFSAFYGPVNT